MKEIEFLVLTHDEGRFLEYGTCFATELYGHFLDWQRPDLADKKKWLEPLEKYISSFENKDAAKHSLDNVFEKNTELDYNFVKELRLYDTIHVSCFSPKNELGETMIKLVSSTDLSFMLTHRIFYDRDSLNLYFYAFHGDFNLDFHKVLTGIEKTCLLHSIKKENIGKVNKTKGV